MDMPGFGRDLVKHTLPIKKGFRPQKQPARNHNPDLLVKIKEVERLLEVGFIWMRQYAEWISNIVPIEKKNKGKIYVCVHLCDVN
jgi:hypothetical protein